MTLRTVLALLLISTSLVSSCSSTKSTEKKIQTAETTYLDAMEAFNDEDYLSAMKYFEIIKLQYPASQFADDAQYYTAEINFKRKEFILAAFNYRLLLTTYRSSEFSKSAYFKQRTFLSISISETSSYNSYWLNKDGLHFDSFRNSFVFHHRSKSERKTSFLLRQNVH